MDWRVLIRRSWAVFARTQGAWPAAPASRDTRLDAAVVAAGYGADVLARLRARLSAPGAQAPDQRLDPLQAHLRQATQTTCGSASLLVARAIVDPVYAMWLLEGYDARADRATDGPAQVRFAVAENQVKARTNAVLGPAGWQLPWPVTLGTPPWGAAAEMTRISGPLGPRYAARAFDPDAAVQRAAAYRAVVQAVANGWPAPVYVGDGASPRHVVLAVAADDQALQVYEPSAGVVVTVARTDLVDGGLVLAGWTTPWAVVVPA